MKRFWQRLRKAVGTYLANDDPLAGAANSGAFLVWSSQPFYPLYVWLLVGSAAWPALLTWLSTPVFASVPLVARQSALAGRATFVLAGVGNTLLSTKAFGVGTSVGWFLCPCFVIAAGFFRCREWPVAVALSLGVFASGLALPHLGEPLRDYTPAQSASLSRLNVWSVIVLSIYLAVSAFRAHRKTV